MAGDSYHQVGTRLGKHTGIYTRRLDGTVSKMPHSCGTPVVPVVKTLLLAEDGFCEGVALLRRLHGRESIPPYKGCCENFSQQLFLFKVLSYYCC